MVADNLLEFLLKEMLENKHFCLMFSVALICQSHQRDGIKVQLSPPGSSEEIQNDPLT